MSVERLEFKDAIDETFYIEGYLIAFEFVMSDSEGAELGSSAGQASVNIHSGQNDTLAAVENELIDMEEGEQL